MYPQPQKNKTQQSAEPADYQYLYILVVVVVIATIMIRLILILRRQISGNIGATAKQLKTVGKWKTNYSQYMDNCIICYSEFKDTDDNIIKIPVCQHCYHHDCILQWFKLKTKCPVCLKDVRQSLIKQTV